MPAGRSLRAMANRCPPPASTPLVRSGFVAAFSAAHTTLSKSWTPSSTLMTQPGRRSADNTNYRAGPPLIEEGEGTPWYARWPRLFLPSFIEQSQVCTVIEIERGHDEKPLHPLFVEVSG